MKIEINLSDDQIRDFAACAQAANMSIERWIEECAAVKATAVIDAIQAPYRKERWNRVELRDTINTRNRRAAKRKRNAESGVFDPADAAERALDQP